MQNLLEGRSIYGYSCPLVGSLVGCRAGTGRRERHRLVFACGNTGACCTRRHTRDRRHQLLYDLDESRQSLSGQRYYPCAGRSDIDRRTGVEVRFANGARMDILGTLLAIGTPAQPISFTAATHTPGSWQGIQLAGTPVKFVVGSLFEHILIEYGGLAIGNGAALRLDYGGASVLNSTIRHSAGHGNYGRLRGLTTLSTVNFEGNADYAALIDDLRVVPFLEYLTASGNGTDSIGVGGAGGSLMGAHTWEKSGIPYQVVSAMTIDHEAVLDIKPGAEVHLEPDATLNVAGRLLAVGEPTDLITFTATDKTPGSWPGLRFLGAEHRAVGTFSYATIEYDGQGEDGVNIDAQSGQVSFDHSIIRNGGASGISVERYLRLCHRAQPHHQSSQLCHLQPGRVGGKHRLGPFSTDGAIHAGQRHRPTATLVAAAAR